MTQVAGDLLQAVILGIIIIVMAVPEGLPLMIAIVSSLNMRKMLNDNVLVRKLVGIETAGSLNLLFTDKTGTITKGKLEVVRFLSGDLQEYAGFGKLPEKIKELTYQQVVLNTSASVTADSIVGGNMREIKSAPGWKAISASRRNWFGGRKTGSGRKGEAWPHSFAF